MVRKFIIAYGTVAPSTEENQRHIAEHFDLVDMSFEAAQYASAIKTFNPDIIIIGYAHDFARNPIDPDWAEVDPHEDWFLHDVNGNRLVRPPWGWYALDVGNPEWVNYYINWVLNKLATFPAVDGIFIDEVLDTFRKTDWVTPEGTPIPPENIPNEIVNRWHNDTLNFLRKVKTALPNNIIIIGSRNLTGDYAREVDGQLWEAFVHPDWWDLDYYGWPEFDPWRHVNNLRTISATGKIALAFSGCKFPDPYTEEDLAKAHNLMLYCLASFLLAASPAKDMFCFNVVQRPDKGYYPEMDIDVGNPRGSYYILANTEERIYGRDFDHAKVFVNFSDTKTYQVTANGLVYTLSPHSGVIAPWEAPPIPPIIPILAPLTVGLILMRIGLI